jgi:hypothetical protein
MRRAAAREDRAGWQAERSGPVGDENGRRARLLAEGIGVAHDGGRKETGMDADGELRTLLRRLAALVVVAVACPLALFGGALVGCATHGFSATCAVDGILVSPPLLAGAGLVAGLLARGRAGFGFVLVGVLAGMVAIPVVATLAGNPVPIDPMQGVIATVFFMPPVLLGYGVGRGLARLLSRSRGTGGTGRR